MALRGARGKPRRISKPLPLDHAYEAARAKRRRPDWRGGVRRTHYGPDLPDRRRRRSPDACAPPRRGGASDAMRPATLRSFRSQQRICGIAAAFLPRRRGAQSGGAGDRAQIVFACAGHQWSLPCASSPARSAGRLHLHSPPSQFEYRRTPAGAEFRTSSEIAGRNGAAFFRPSRSHRQYAGPFLAAEIYVEGFGLSSSRNIRRRKANRKCNSCASAPARE